MNKSHATKAYERCAVEMEDLIRLSGDFGFDEMTVAALETARDVLREKSTTAQAGAELPELPEPVWDDSDFGNVYTADQMRQYALDYITRRGGSDG